MSIINEVAEKLNPLPDTEESIFKTHTIKVVSDVINTYSTYPATGVYSDSNISGWRWSRTFPQNSSARNQRINNSLGGSNYSVEEGSKLENWQGAVLGGLELESIREHYDSVRSKWQPHYSTGEYSLYHKTKRLYSDYSLCSVLFEEEYFEEEDIDGNITEIAPPKLNMFDGAIKNITVAMYKRDKRFVNFPFLKYKFDPSESEKYSYNLEDQEDENGNLQTYLSYTELKTHKVGGYPDKVEAHPDILNTWEYAGKGNDGRSLIYSEYFPIIKDSFKLVEVVGDEITFWTEVSEFSYSGEEEYLVDYANGIISINSISEEVEYAVEDSERINPNWVKYTFKKDIKENLPKNGYIRLNQGGRPYEYRGLFKNGLYVKTLITAFQRNQISFPKQGADFTLGSDIYIMYNAGVRVDYETANETLLYRSEKEIDLKPYVNAESRGLIEINPYEKHVSDIVLSAEKNSIVMGLESLRIKADVLNSSNGRVKEVDVNFECSAGNFNNGDKTAVARTNGNGEAFVYYNWPYNEKDSYVWFGSDKVEHIGSDTILTVDSSSLSELDINSASIFQTLKTDPFYGFGGLKLTAEIRPIVGRAKKYILTFNEEGLDLEEYLSNEMMFLENQTQDYLPPDDKSKTNNHAFGFLEFGGIEYKFLVHKVNSKNQLIIGTNTPAMWIQTKPITLYKSNELKYDPQTLVDRGLSLDRLMYIDDGQPDLTALTPTRFLTEEGKIKIVFENILLPLPSDSDPSNIVAGYKMFLDKKATIRAKTTDPASGREISSNTLKINVGLPEFLKRNSGFKIGSEEQKQSGFGGTNFLHEEDNPDVILYNPFTNRINIIVDATEDVP